MTKNGSFLIRIGMSFFWVVVIILFLLLPQLFTLFQEKKHLNIFAPALVIDPASLEQFEKETGIHVSITYFDNPAALLNKMEVTKGLGYDLIIADDHSISVLLKKKMLQKIDPTSFSFFNDINLWLLNTYYDKKNEYSLPYYWGVFGIGYDENYFENPPLESWRLIFDPKVSPSLIGMTDEAREATMIAAFYLFGSIDALKDENARKAVVELLKEQKKRVVSYTIQLADRLLQMRTAPVATIMSPDWWRLRPNAPHVKWFIPESGSFMTIDAMVIPKASTKYELVHSLIEFIFRPEVIKHQCQVFGFCSPRISVTVPEQEMICSRIKEFDKFDLFRDIVSNEVLNDMWIQVLAS